MHTLRVPALLVATAGLLAACGGTSSSPTASSVATTTTPSSTIASTTTTAPTGPFVSTLYGYTVKSLKWTGTVADTAWDGTGSPGDGDPTVDVLTGPGTQHAWAFAGATKASLKTFAAKFRATNANVHPCPAKPETTTPITIANQPAILDEMHCPPQGGVFALNAFVIHHGHVYVFFTYDQPGNEAAMRTWFRSLLKTVSLHA